MSPVNSGDQSLAGIWNSSRASPKHVALLRGINVGGKHALPMKELAAMFEAGGAKDVTTYIQSGNVVFRATPAAAAKCVAAVTEAIAKRYGYDVPIVLRSAAELRAAVEASPFLAQGVSADELHLACLRDRPTKVAVAALDAARFAPDELAVVGSDVHLHLPNGVGKSKLTNAWLDRGLATVSTLRNWRTVRKLLELADG